MKLAIIGAGSTGLLLAAKLADAGCQVTVYPRTASQLDRLRAGITVTGLTELSAVGVGLSQLPRQAELQDGEMPVHHADWVIVTVKQPQLTEELQAQCAGAFGASARFLFIQNGIGHGERFAGVVAAERIYVAVTTEGARRISENAVQHTGSGETAFGPLRPKVADFQDVGGEALRRMLTAAGFRSIVTGEMGSRIWEKLIVNSVINPLTAILRVPNGELPATDKRLRFMRLLYEEAVRTAAAEGIVLSPQLWSKILDICHATAANRSSMLQDVDSARPTEIDAITGSLLKVAERHGVPLPTHRVIYDLIGCLQPARSFD